MQGIVEKKRKAVNAVYFSWGLAVYFAWVLNFPFILDAYRFIHQANGEIITLLLMLPVCLFLSRCFLCSALNILKKRYTLV